MKDTQKPATSTTPKDDGPAGFTDEHRAAMREHAQELKMAARDLAERLNRAAE